jgi:NADH-quinone oxidoreductase subunit A
VDPVGTARERFSIKFYMVAVLFILFDIEAVFLYPWAVAFKQLGLYGLIEGLLFIGILLVGYLYVIKKKALDWD